MPDNESASADAHAEQPCQFDYNYRMRCSCGNLSDVPSALFASQWIIEGGSVPCQTCGNGTAVLDANIALRDPDDLALNAGEISNLAWYHTSTHEDWPPRGYAAAVAAERQYSRMTMPPDVFARMLYREQTKALHLGTYASAIENMHRRMRNEADADSQFYLYRVTVNLAPKEVDANVRHESHQEASQLTLDDLGSFRAVRYLNVEESPGSISLAVNPSAITAVQMLPLPRESLALPAETHIITAAAQADTELDDLNARLRYLPSYGFTEGVKLRRKGDVDALLRAELEQKVNTIWQRVILQLADTYLVGVNPVVREHFMNIVALPDDKSATSLHDTFRMRAALLVRSTDVVSELARQPRKTPPGSV